MQSVVLTSFDLVLHIQLAGRVIAHQHDGQAGRDAARAQRRRAFGNVKAQLLGKGDSVDDLCRHEFYVIL